MGVTQESLLLTNARNVIHSFDPNLLTQLRIDATGIGLRVEKISKTRAPKKEHQAAWLEAAIGLIDLTTLEGSDTDERVNRLAHKAVRPWRAQPAIHAAALCVYGNLVPQAKKFLDGSPVKIAAVSTSFPHGQTPLAIKIQETKALVAAGADEIDMVISRNALLRGDHYKVYEEIAETREACGDAHLKVILETGELSEFRQIWIASEIAMQAGADFIKTSTGKIQPAATLEAGLIMLQAIDQFHRRTGYKIGFKPAGGIRSAKQALTWMALVQETLADDWVAPRLLRLGASSLLDDIIRQLHHLKTGQYESYDYIPKG
ncbi:MAG: deoxyribose-phosphate aldolase [Elusimicrobia bacterium]|nr:deoxyribose-phosphate aldolase [Elusimicrobiota bacterium]